MIHTLLFYLLFMGVAIAALPHTPPDYLGISSTVIAIATLISTILGGIALIINAIAAARMKRAEALVLEAKREMGEVRKAVDGQTTALLKLGAEKAAAEATLEEKAKQAERDSAIKFTAAAVGAEVEKARQLAHDTALAAKPVTPVEIVSGPGVTDQTPIITKSAKQIADDAIAADRAKLR